MSKTGVVRAEAQCAIKRPDAKWSAPWKIKVIERRVRIKKKKPTRRVVVVEESSSDEDDDGITEVRVPKPTPPPDAALERARRAVFGDYS